jgi:hypothetical protein
VIEPLALGDARRVVARSRRLTVLVGILLSLVIPGGVVVAGFDDALHGTSWAKLDILARVVLLGAPAILAGLSLFHRPALLVVAAASTLVLIPLHIIGIPTFVAAALWATAYAGVPRGPLSSWRYAQIVIASASILTAGILFFFAPGPAVCTTKTTYADGTVRSTSRVQADPSRSTGSAELSPGGVVSVATTCSNGASLPERSIPIIAFVLLGIVIGSCSTKERSQA